MDVVALVQGREHVCARYRIAQYARHLTAVGLKLILEPLAYDPWERVQQLTRRRDGQIVVLVRKLLPVWQLLLLRRRTPLLAYDFDDAVFLRDSFHPRGPHSVTRAIRFRATMALSDVVFAGNKHLADEALRRGGRRKVEIIPTCVDATRYEPAVHRENPPTRLVWIGSSSTLPALEDARPMLEEVGEAVPNTVLRVICNQFPKFRHLRVEPAPWSSATEPMDLSSSDVGISWIPDDAWSRGKCGLKVLQYMAAGLPVVASPIGVHPELVPEAAGFLPKSRSEWVDCIRRLSDDRKLRQAMGREGRSTLESGFTVDSWGPVLATRLKEAGAAR